MDDAPLAAPSLAELRRRLDEVERWCGSRVSATDPAGSLRSVELAPALQRDVPWVDLDVVASVTSRRRVLLARELAASPGAAAGGRLLVFDGANSLSDGAAEVLSDGYFDADNTPPWDTWLAFVHAPESPRSPWFQTFLLAWVPPVFVSLVDAGIDANPEQCILWANDPALAGIASLERLRAANLLT